MAEPNNRSGDTSDMQQHGPPETEPVEDETMPGDSQEVMSVADFANNEDVPPSNDNTEHTQENTQDSPQENSHGPEVEGVAEVDDDEDDMDQDPEDSQQEVMDTIEQELGLDPGSLQPVAIDATMAAEDEIQEQDDTAMAEDDEIQVQDDNTVANQNDEHQEPNGTTMNNFQSESVGAANIRVQVVPEPLEGLQSMIEDQNEGIEHAQANDVDMHSEEATEFQPAHVVDDDLDNDASSLFVSERASPNPQLSTRPGSAINMPPPSRPSATPTVPGNSTYARIRNAQKKLAEKKNADARRQVAHQYQANPDNEAYLEAVLSSVNPSASTLAPKVDEHELAHRQALAEFDKQRRYYNELRRKNSGRLTFRQDVEWMKIRGAEDARIMKRKRDIAKAQEDEEVEPDLFPEVRPQVDNNKDDDSDNAFDLDTPGPSRKRPRQPMPRKEPKQVSMQEAEFQSMKVALEADEDVPKKKWKSQPTDDDSQDTRASGKGRGKAKATKPKPKTTRAKAGPKTATGGRKTAKSKREVDHALRQTTSLFNSNVFEQQAGEGEADQPVFRTRNKQDALKELIASIPLEDHKQARSDMSVLLAATREFDGHGAVKVVGGNWLVKGMKTSLKGYQVLGSAFMRRRENAAEEPKGGLMADQMGESVKYDLNGRQLLTLDLSRARQNAQWVLHITCSLLYADSAAVMLANIVNGQPPKGEHPRTTLLVASPALLSQWGKEIEQHTACGLKIMRYGAGTRIDSNHTFEILKHHDIILTTYGEVMKSYPKNEPPIDCQTAEQKMVWWKSVYETQRGVLHRMMFLRVVLDEAQAIKNHMGRTSIACRALMAQHKWALSGTPILNSLTELYPYFKFLGVPHTGSFKIFKNNYCDTNDAENTERLLVRLSQFMIRRTHADRMFNAPILKLPQAAQGTFLCKFNSVERCVYDIVRQRFAKNINMWQKKGELEKSYSNALVMLLRLRQLTAHVLMLQFVMKDLLEVEDIERIKEVVNEESADRSTRRGRTIIAIRKQLEKHAIEGKKNAAAKAAEAAAKAAGEVYVDGPADDEVAQEEEVPEPEESERAPSQSIGETNAGDGGCGKTFGKEYNFKPYLNSLKTGESWEKAKKKAKCSWCGKPPKKPWKASCTHLICETPCMDQAYIEAAEVGKQQAPCKACGVTPTSVLQFELDEEDEFEPVAIGTRSNKSRKAAKQRERRDREDIAEDWLSLAGEEVLPSAKTLAIKAQVLNWTKEDPKVKIIIYTQFLAM
jgi:SNF2 family DNA or RNA helicase